MQLFIFLPSKNCQRREKCAVVEIPHYTARKPLFTTLGIVKVWLIYLHFLQNVL